MYRTRGAVRRFQFADSKKKLMFYCRCDEQVKVKGGERGDVTDC